MKTSTKLAEVLCILGIVMFLIGLITTAFSFMSIYIFLFALVFFASGLIIFIAKSIKKN